MNKESVIILGGDKRQRYIKEILTEKDYICEYENQSADNIEEKLPNFRYVVLPVPSSKDKKHIYSENKTFVLSFDRLCEVLTDRHTLLSAGLDKRMIDLLKEKNIPFYDLNNDEDFLVYNAFLTAQGTLKLLLDNTEKHLNGRKVLITGFGRISKSLATLLKNLNLSITVCLRKDNQQNLAECMGFNTIRYNSLADILPNTDFIFNTVPERIFNVRHIEKMKSDSVYFELASAPFGVDRELFSNTKTKFVDSGALPGRFIPYSAGEKIAKFIENFIQRSETYANET